jgi:ribosomal protein S18 acetylase RimI-like enzyme
MLSGIGRQLVDQVLRLARTENIADVELTSWCFNTEAQAAFRKLGFAPKVIRFARKLGAENAWNRQWNADALGTGSRARTSEMQERLASAPRGRYK